MAEADEAAEVDNSDTTRHCCTVCGVVVSSGVWLTCLLHHLLHDGLIL